MAEQETDRPAEGSPFQRFLRRRPQQARSRALVEALVESLDDLLTKGEGWDQLTLKILVRRAGVGIGSFYEYFGNKDALLGALIGAVTRENFISLLEQTEAATDLEEQIDITCRAVAEAYLAHPIRMRAIVNGIGRLRLLDIVIRERDRFAHELADRAHVHLPNEDIVKLRETMRMISDSAMGLVVGELYREVDIELATRQVRQVAHTLIRERHTWPSPEPG